MLVEVKMHEHRRIPLTTQDNCGKGSMAVVNELKYMEEKENTPGKVNMAVANGVRHPQGECQSVMFGASCRRWSESRDEVISCWNCSFTV